MEQEGSVEADSDNLHPSVFTLSMNMILSMNLSMDIIDPMQTGFHEPK